MMVILADWSSMGVLLAASASTLFGVFAGAWLGWRLKMGMSPLPRLPSWKVTKLETPPAEGKERPKPRIGV